VSTLLLARLTSGADLPLVIAGSIWLATRALTVLTAMYGSKECSRRALEVLRLMRRNREIK
jgi:hypothetical protein